jgi:hypothetical protein
MEWAFVRSHRGLSTIDTSQCSDCHYLSAALQGLYVLRAPTNESANLQCDPGVGKNSIATKRHHPMSQTHIRLDTASYLAPA